MSFNVSWDVNKYREDHESEEHWQLRKAFMVRWKNEYPEERLVCLARVFANMEFMGCRYPVELMQEVARLSGDVAKQYRNSRKDKLQRTFVSASDAAEDRAKGVKREGGVIIDTPPAKSQRINFVPQSNDATRLGNTNENGPQISNSITTSNNNDPRQNEISNKNGEAHNIDISNKNTENVSSEGEDDNYENQSNTNTGSVNNFNNSNSCNDTSKGPNDLKAYYQMHLSTLKYLSAHQFNERMFDMDFGKFVLIIRPWNTVTSNVINSFISCKLLMGQSYVDGVFTITVNNKVLVQEKCNTKAIAKDNAYHRLWEKLRRDSISLLLKEQFIPQNDTRITMDDMSNKHDFGTPIEDSVALKMMKLMGWKGGGLGADSQGIAEPIKANFTMVNRAGLGHEGKGDLQQLRRAGHALLKRRAATLDADLVFAAEFTAEERAVLHHCASSLGLHSKSYGPKGKDRFLVISNKVEPFSLVRAVVQRGGETPKYRVYIPESLRGHECKGDLQQLRRAGHALLKRRAATLDADLVFAAEFTPEERAVLHHCASSLGLHSKSYGPKGKDRFLVISNKVEPFSLVRAVVQRGGETPKYRVYIPESLRGKT